MSKELDRSRPLDPDKIDQIYEEATMAYIRLFNRWTEWVRSGKPATAEVPEPPDPRTWPEDYHPDVRSRLREFLNSHAARHQGPDATDSCPADWPSHVSLADFVINRKPDGTEEELGRGGMGVIVSAQHKSLGRPVAIKFMLPHLRSNAELVEQFRLEAQLQSQLQHAGIAPVYQIGRDETRGPFIVMQPISGRSLCEYLELGADRNDIELLDVFRKIAQTVDYAHQQNKVNLDLKPGNVLVRADEVWILDWGLSKATEKADKTHNIPELDSRSAAGDAVLRKAIRGTPAYMPPEQACGELGVGPQADVFALGVILYQILTGKPLYSGTTSEILAQAKGWVIGDALERLGACGKDPELIALCRHCLAKLPGDRPANGGAVVKALNQYRDAVATKRLAAIRDETATQTRAKEWWKKCGLGLLVLAAGAAIVVFVLLNRNDRKEKERRFANSIELCENSLRSEDAENAAAILNGVDTHLIDVRVEAVQDRLDRCRSNLTLLQNLRRIDEFSWMPGDGGLPSKKRLAAELAEALRQFGIVPKTTSPTDAAQRVNNSLLRSRLMGALDLWLMSEPSPELQAILEATDPDEYRDKIRVSVAAGNKTELAKLAQSDAVFTQPPRFVTAFARIEELPVERKRAVLRTAQRDHDKDLGILMELSGLYSFGQLDGASERVKWLSQAVALPRSCVAAHHNLGLALLDQGAIQDAIREFTNAGNIQKSALTLSGLGDALYLKGDLDEAIHEFKAASSLDSKLALPHTGLGYALHRRGTLDESIREFKTAIQLDASSATARSGLGCALTDQGHLEEAVVAFQAAIKLDARSTPAYDGLWRVLKKQGHLDEAIRVFRTATESDPTFAPHYYGLGHALAAKGHLDEAIRTYRIAIERNPRLAQPHDGVGNALAAKGDLWGARQEFKAAVDLNPNFAAAHNGLGNVLWAQNDRAAALREFKAAIALDSKFAAPHNGLGNALAHLGELDRAIREYKTAIELDAKFAAPHFGLGTVLWLQGDRKGAMSAVKSAIAIDPNFTSAYIKLGNILCQENAFDEAIVEFTKAIKLDPKLAEPLCALGEYAVKDKRHLNAVIQAFKTSIERDPDCLVSHVGMGDVLWLNQDWSGAVEAYRQAIRLRTTREHPYQRAATLLAKRGERLAALQILRDGLKVDASFIKLFRNDMACYACRLASDQANDGPPKLDGRALRGEGLTWLSAELAAQRTLAANGASTVAVHKVMRTWLANPDLDSVRDFESLPEDERDAWNHLWAEIRKLRDQTSQP
ncbi:MAG: tetratricopeptide repeat protein [Planctomycetes bacterium]|nr:tetratricopeptide repeat protein [Planctomycetota bacterium]